MPAKPTLLLKTSLLLFSVLLFSCSTSKGITQKFSTGQDTLVLYTTKQKGMGLFMQSAVPNQFSVDSSAFSYSLTLPKNMASVYRAALPVDPKQEVVAYVDVISGMQNGKPVYIVDQNNNRNLTDDPVYHWQPFEWHNPTRLVPCTYTASNGRKASFGNSWLNIGFSKDTTMLIGRSEHVTSRFRLGKDIYTIAVAEPYAPLFFIWGIKPIAALTAQNSVVKDSLPVYNLVEQNQYFNLGGQHYRFDHITKDGRQVTLVKEHNFSSIVGLQPGMTAPAFTATTTSGQTVTSNGQATVYTIISNSCACGGDVATAAAGAEISRLYGNKAIVLNLDMKPTQQLGYHTIDCDAPLNKQIYDDYRTEYCSRITYVISPDGHIAHKFETTQWQKHLPQLFN